MPEDARRRGIEQAPVVITKRGKPVAKLVPITSQARKTGLAGSVLKEVGDPYGTGERWDADADPA